mmetsp:Transcript_7887/g.31152  ORF Transcript_7887/g.31152 Transcript_7887/m.31152 type:complete len:254 (+) Transcript_7887:1752-2513(+)
MVPFRLLAVSVLQATRFGGARADAELLCLGAGGHPPLCPRQRRRPDRPRGVWRRQGERNAPVGGAASAGPGAMGRPALPAPHARAAHRGVPFVGAAAPARAGGVGVEAEHRRDGLRRCLASDPLAQYQQGAGLGRCRGGRPERALWLVVSLAAGLARQPGLGCAGCGVLRVRAERHHGHARGLHAGALQRACAGHRPAAGGHRVPHPPRALHRGGPQPLPRPHRAGAPPGRVRSHDALAAGGAAEGQGAGTRP